jgi:protein AIR1/2
MHESGDSDDSEPLDSEVDDSIMLNIGSRHRTSSLGKDENDGLSDEDDYDPESLPTLDETLLNGTTDHAPNGTTQKPVGAQSKENALQILSQKYPMAPTSLADLERSDMDAQARFLFYDQDINGINLQLPVTCTECFRQGHLAEVCPFKEVRFTRM